MPCEAEFGSVHCWIQIYVLTCHIINFYAMGFWCLAGRTHTHGPGRKHRGQHFMRIPQCPGLRPPAESSENFSFFSVASLLGWKMKMPSQQDLFSSFGLSIMCSPLKCLFAKYLHKSFGHAQPLCECVWVLPTFCLCYPYATCM